MAKNDFKAFATSSDANVISQDDYEALAARSSGFQSGVANSAQLNKVWRQSSIMSAVLAQFITDRAGQDAIDDGSTDTLSANLKTAIFNDAELTGAPTATTADAGDKSTRIATTEFVRQASCPVVGSARNVVVSVTSASTSATVNADEIVVETTLGGAGYRVANVNESINLATNGAGGMDAGSAPASGFVAIYVIYNSSTGARALLATNATSSIAPEVYGGANLPAGYTASALVSVWPTNGSGQLTIANQVDRDIFFPNIMMFTTAMMATEYVKLSVSDHVPMNARRLRGINVIAVTDPVNSIGSTQAASENGMGAQNTQSSGYSGVAQISDNFDIPLLGPQTMYYTFLVGAGVSHSLSFVLSSYEI